MKETQRKYRATLHQKLPTGRWKDNVENDVRKRGTGTGD
jgi:hypothetical protein